MIRVFVESSNKNKSDKGFIEAYASYLDIDTNTFEVIGTGGWTKLRTEINLYRDNREDRKIVIFDADSIEQDLETGGFEQRKAAIEALKVELGLDFDLFLFPNNSDNGDLETLLERIVPEKHQKLMDCFDLYEKCVSSHAEYQVPIRKSKIYAYLDAFPKSRSQKEAFKNGKWFEEKLGYWNYESKELESLKAFLCKHLLP